MSRLSDAAGGSSRIGKAGRKAEKKTLESYGAAPVPNSGAANAKGDGTLPGFLMEIKSTQKESLTLKLDTLHKIAGEAYAEGVEPCLAIAFTDGGGDPRFGGSWVCITRDLFEELTNGD